MNLVAMTDFEKVKPKVFWLNWIREDFSQLPFYIISRDINGLCCLLQQLCQLSFSTIYQGNFGTSAMSESPFGPDLCQPAK